MTTPNVPFPEANEQTRLVARNRMALVGWIFMAIWLGLLTIFTVLFLKNGGFGQFGQGIETAIMLVFWLFGLAGAAHMFSAPLIHVSRNGSNLDITERWLLRRAHHIVAINEAAPPRLVEDKDRDGDPYFRVVLTLPDDHRITLHEGHDRDTADGHLKAILAALE